MLPILPGYLPAHPACEQFEQRKRWRQQGTLGPAHPVLIAAERGRSKQGNKGWQLLLLLVAITHGKDAESQCQT